MTRQRDKQRSLNLANERGMGILEVIFSLGIELVIIAGVIHLLIPTTQLSHDEPIINRAEENAQTILDFMAYDIRMMGTGMPMGQASFLITDATLGNAPYPILTTATSSYLQLRLNQTGQSTVLSASYTPSASSLSFNVMSTTGLAVGDTIYLNDVTEGGSSGMRAVITALTNTSITISSSYTAVAGVQFPAGTDVQKVSTVTYSSPVGNSGITRSDGSGTVTLAPNSSFSITYLDTAGATLTPPLTTANIGNQLSAIRLTVSVPADRSLLTKANYTATSTQTISLRNLILSR